MGITKREIASELGVSKRTIANYIGKLGLGNHVSRNGNTDILDDFAAAAIADALKNPEKPSRQPAVAAPAPDSLADSLAAQLEIERSRNAELMEALAVERDRAARAEAEAKAHENLGEGIRLLNEFMNNYRIVGGGYDCTNMSSSVENFTNELMLQKRIEFWGEGIVMFDMKRLDMSTRRGYVGTNSPASYRLNTEGRAPYWNFVISRGETQNNPVIATQNNPDPSQTVKPWNG